MTLKPRKTLTFIALALASGALIAQADEHLSARVNAFRASEQLDGDHDFKELRQHHDDAATIHHLQQRFRGIKVWGAHTNIREVNGEANIVAKKVFKNINIDIKPSLTEADVLNVVDYDLRNARSATFAPQILNPLDIALDGAASERAEGVRHHSKPEVELAILPIEEMRVLPKASGKTLAQLNAEDVTYETVGYRLAYHVATDADVQGRREMRNYLVDALSGEVLKVWDPFVKRTTAAGTAITKYSGSVTLYTNLNGSTYEAKDPTYCNNYVVNASGTLYTDANNTWGNGGNWADGTTEGKQTGAAEALYVLQRECQMLKAVFGRNGSSGTGTAMKVFWAKDPASNTACYITQNYITSGYADSYFYDMNKLDVLGHEYGHSLDYYTAYMCYDDTGEAGGMAEAHGDIMGLLTEVYGKYTANDPTNPATTIPEEGLTDPKTWICGEDAAKSTVNGGKGLRFFIKPSLDTMEGTINAWQSNMSSVEVHAAAGPTDRMFYYLAAGAPSSTTHDGYTSYLPNGSTGVGMHKAAMIWYKAVTGGALSSSSKHTDARNACISAAQTLYGAGGPEEQAVWNAYHGINVGNAWGVNVAINPSAASVKPSATYQFSASVTGTSNTAVTWSVVESGGGTVSATGLYTAPATAGTYHVKVTSQADPSASATATVTVSTANDLIANGGFEGGITGWSGTTGDIGTWTGQPAYQGVANAWMLGNGATATETLYQTVTIPSTATTATLSFYLHIDTAETSTTKAYDKLVVSLQKTSGTNLKTLATYSNLNKNTGYLLRTFDVSAYKGQTLRVYFKGTEDSSLQTSFVLDNVSLLVK